MDNDLKYLAFVLLPMALALEVNAILQKLVEAMPF